MEHSTCESIYDIKNITRTAKIRFIKKVVSLFLLLIIAVLCILSVIFYSDKIYIFIPSAAVFVLSYFLFMKILKKTDFSSLRSTEGTISDIDVQVKTIRQTIGSIGLRARQYDHYRHEETSIGIYINDGDGITSYHIDNVTSKQVEYYRNKSRVVHVYATRFPIKLNADNEEWYCSNCKTKNSGADDACVNCRCHRENDWLCPICGTFNGREAKNCSVCKTKVIK